MKRQDFESSDLNEIEAELLRLMRNPKCYAISTFSVNGLHRVRLIRRHSARLWVSEYEVYDPLCHGSPFRRMKPSCFSKYYGNLAPKFAEHIASHAAFHSRYERTIIEGWFA